MDEMQSDAARDIARAMEMWSPPLHEVAAKAILIDLSDRRGIKAALSDCDEEVYADIEAKLAEIIRQVYLTA